MSTSKYQYYTIIIYKGVIYTLIVLLYKRSIIFDLLTDYYFIVKYTGIKNNPIKGHYICLIGSYYKILDTRRKMYLNNDNF
jgi:hypothetical protein